MPLDSTVGGAESNSYVSLVESNEYFQHRYHATTRWNALDDPSKESLLITSTSMVDWYMNFIGEKTSTTQSLQWPRAGVLLLDGTPVLDNIIPVKVKHAVYELAFSSLKSDRLVENKLAGLSMLKAGPLQIKASEGGYNSTEKSVVPDYIYKILEELIDRAGISVVRLVRA